MSDSYSIDIPAPFDELVYEPVAMIRLPPRMRTQNATAREGSSSHVNAKQSRSKSPVRERGYMMCMGKIRKTGALHGHSNITCPQNG